MCLPPSPLTRSNTHHSNNRTRVDGKFLGPGGIIPTSQAICSSLLEECFEIAQEIKAHEDSKNVASSLKPIYDRLSEIRAELESLVMTHRWSLRETDLWNYSLSLQEIDKMRVDGKFVDSEGNRPSGQYVSLSFRTLCFFGTKQIFFLNTRSFSIYSGDVMASSTDFSRQASRCRRS